MTRRREIVWLRHISVCSIQLYCEQGLVRCPTEHMCTMLLSLFMNQFPSLPQYWRTDLGRRSRTACLPNCKITKCVMSEAYNSPYSLEILDPCYRIWRLQQGNPSLRVAVSACGSMVELASLGRLEADRLAWSCLLLLPALPFYQSNTHHKCCPRFHANPTGKSSSTSHLHPAHWHAVVSQDSRPASLRWVRHSFSTWEYYQDNS